MGRNEMIHNRIRGALYGVAVGDALGGPLEFMSAAAIHKKHGTVTEMIGGGWLNLKPGETTDDTAMTLAVAQGIAENPADPVPCIGRNFIKWRNSGPADIGITCATAIELADRMQAKTEEEWLKVGYQTWKLQKGRNAGNGALMRTVYTGLFYADPEDREAMTKIIGQMTHDHMTSIIVCEEYAHAVHKAVFGGHPSFTIDKIYHRETDPTGYSLDSFTNAVYALDIADSFEEAIIYTVNRGGDADTIGAIAGGLAGARYGYNNIPERWLNALDPELKKELDRLADIAYAENERYYRTGRKGVRHGN